jgi:hypothetical protein
MYRTTCDVEVLVLLVRCEKNERRHGWTIAADTTTLGSSGISIIFALVVGQIKTSMRSILLRWRHESTTDVLDFDLWYPIIHSPKSMLLPPLLHHVAALSAHEAPSSWTW